MARAPAIHTKMHTKPCADEPALAPKSEALDALTSPHITRLRLTRFRSHEALDLACANGAVVITGANGIGKTNVLEAISMLAPGRGLRSATFEALQYQHQGGWTVLADVQGAMGELRAGVAFDGDGGRRVRIDGTTRRVEDLAQAVPQLWLTPAMDRLFSDGASGRRKFLDRFAQTLDSGLSRHLSAYEKAMRERNRLLVTAGTPFSQNSWLDGIEETMGVEGVAIANARLGALDALAVGLGDVPEAAFPRAEIALEGTLEAALRTAPAVDVEDAFRARLLQARPLDANAGRTLEGPHRSDLQVSYMAKNMPAAACSTGEQKALLVGLILAQAHSVAARIGQMPLLLLDEVAAHLDPHRRAALADILTHLGGQSWITGTEAAAFSGFAKNAPMTAINMTAMNEAVTIS